MSIEDAEQRTFFHEQLPRRKRRNGRDDECRNVLLYRRIERKARALAVYAARHQRLGVLYGILRK